MTMKIYYSLYFCLTVNIKYVFIGTDLHNGFVLINLYYKYLFLLYDITRRHLTDWN